MLEKIFNNLEMPKNVDWLLLLVATALILLGAVMVASTTLDKMDFEKQQPWYYFVRHLFYLAIGIFCALLTVCIPISFWKDYNLYLLLISFFLLIIVLIPGLGVSVNGARRWLNLGLFNFQPSEFAKFAGISFLAVYLVNRQNELRSSSIKDSLTGFIKIFIIFCVMSGLFFAEPDFGTTVILMTASLVLLYLGGLDIKGVLLPFAFLLLVLTILVWIEPYRLSRIFGGLNAWQDPYGKGYQVIQALIAFGRADIWGAGIGNSVQKLYFLPDAHTDFIFAILAEELGIIGAIVCLLLFVVLCLRAFYIGINAEAKDQLFAAYLAYGLTLLWMGQIIINIGVNVNVLPPKGLTLPFISYGGSSLLMCCFFTAILLRIDWETRSLPVVEEESLSDQENNNE